VPLSAIRRKTALTFEKMHLLRKQWARARVHELHIGVSTASRDALGVNAYQSIGRLWATATAMQPFGIRYFPSPSHMTVSPVGSVHTYWWTGAESGLRLTTSRLSTLQVDRSGSLTMTSDKREPEAINLPSIARAFASGWVS